MKFHFLTASFALCSHFVLAAELTPAEVEGRLRVALQMARERNDPGLVADVERVGGSFKEALPANADEQLRRLEVRVGIDSGGWSMAGQPIFHPTPEMAARSKELGQRLHQAMQTDDPAPVRAVAAEMLHVLGNQAGVPDARRLGHKPKGMHLTENQATELFVEALKSEGRAMRSIMDGQPLPDQMLRIYGSLLSATAEIHPFVEKHRPADLADLQRLADGCATILINLQQSEGHFPFPDLRGKNIRFGDMINREAEAERVEVRDGWVITADPNGGSQFDTGVCSTALLRAGEAFEKEAWLKAGKRGAEWALQQQCCANFNYNAFSVSLLAHAYRITNDERFLKSALQKFRVGIAPGQAPNGRWIDAHNARTVYHVIILRALGDLAAVLNETERSEVDRAARPAIRALLDEFEAMGITVEALPELATLSRLYPEDARLKSAVSVMASSLIEKSTDGKRARMGAQPHQLAAVPQACAP